MVFSCYKPIFTDRAENSEPAKRLLNILGVIDRLHAEGQQIPDAMLLALLLVPWAQESLQLMADVRKGAEAFAFARRLRQELDEILLPLNVNRSMKEEMTTLLANLPLFKQFYKKRDWPKWLKRKSYYQKAFQFYRIYQEATGGAPVDALTLPVSPKPKPRKRTTRKDSRNPAFSKKSGGVFGLRNR